MHKLLELHGWKAAALLSTAMLSAAIVCAAWLLSPPRYLIEKTTFDGSSRQRLVRVDARTGQMRPVVVGPEE